MTGSYKYEVIKKLVDTNGNKKSAALKLGCTMRNINRLILGYKTKGKDQFQHGNSGKPSIHALSKETRQMVIDLYRTKYHDANFTHFSELLLARENIIASKTTIRSILMEENILSPMATRAVRKALRKQLEQDQEKTSSKREQDSIQAKIVALEDAHPRRPRCAYFGEMIQMDASVDHWFGSAKAQLHIGVDDSTGTIVGAYFDTEETLKGYYNIFHQILTNYGIPYLFYTDRRTVFEYKQKGSPSIEEDTFTQFGYACKQLGVTIKTTSIPEAKGRVERMFQTLQSRLPVELRLAGATTIEQANEFLNSYIKEFNAKFALPINYTKSVFEAQPSDEQINLTLAILTQRKIDSGHSIRFNKKYFKPVNDLGHPVYYQGGTTCMVIQAFDSRLFTCVGEKVYALDEIPKHERISKDFDVPQAATKPRKRYVPPMSHPWRAQAFTKHVNAQQHRIPLSPQEYEDSLYSQEIIL